MAYLKVTDKDGERDVELILDKTTLGRSRNCDIKLEDDECSRQHCQIVRLPHGYKLLDLDSSNGTFVNNHIEKEVVLDDGDKIEVGDSKIIFYEKSLAPVPKPKAPPAEPLEAKETTLHYIKDKNIQILLETLSGSTAVGMKFDDFLANILDAVIDITSAERGIIFLKEEDRALEPTLARNNKKEILKDVTDCSRSIPERVIASKESLCLLDSGSEKEQQTASMKMFALHTVMCVPLVSKHGVLGALYVDSHAGVNDFKMDDLTLFEAISNHLALTIENARLTEELLRKKESDRAALERENLKLRQTLENRAHIIVGESPQMKAIYDTIRKSANSNATVLITGESGTGKEVVAHLLHELSDRAKGPFVTVDCASIPETLLESEFFGYEKGAFTGAVAQKLGKFELANDGTIFLDEIGEMPPTLQVKLLRAIEGKSIMHIGGTKPIDVDVRIITATNKDIKTLAYKGSFRQDLYYRLNVVNILLPPLRERGQDIMLLANHFLKQANLLNGRNIKGFASNAIEAMEKHRWPGNVRELMHRMEQAVILAEPKTENLNAHDLGFGKGKEEFSPFEEARDNFEKEFVELALARNNYNVTHTAKAVGLSRQHMQNLIKKHNIEKAVG